METNIVNQIAESVRVADRAKYRPLVKLQSTFHACEGNLQIDALVRVSCNGNPYDVVHIGDDLTLFLDREQTLQLAATLAKLVGGEA